MDKFKVLDLFSGIGGFSLGLERTGGFETVAFCEIEEFPRKVLNKHWPGVPIYEDVRELTAERLKADGIGVDIITGGFPCQDLSFAGNQEGIEAERSGLWSEISRLISEIRPQYAIVENVSALLTGESGRWFQRILRDLAPIGYDAEWHCIPAHYIGAPQNRDRVWIIANPSSDTAQEQKMVGQVIEERKVYGEPGRVGRSAWSGWSMDQCSLVGMADGVSAKMDRDRIKGLGNAVVPQIPELIGRAILDSEQ